MNLKIQFFENFEIFVACMRLSIKKGIYTNDVSTDDAFIR